MIPFPGESLNIRAATDVGGAYGEDLGDLVEVRAGSATLTAGSEWVAWVRAGVPDYLEDDTTPVVVSWVVEVLSGSVTVAASEGHHSFIDETDPTGTALGTVVLSAGTNVVTSTFDAADTLTGGGYLMLRLLASSGSAVVQQVKMRVWPPEGVAGGWSDPYPSYTREAIPTVRRLFDRRQIATDAASIGAHLDEPVSIGTVVGEATGQVDARSQVVDSVLTVLVQMQAFIYTRPAADTYQADVDSTLGLVDGVDYIRPPEEVGTDFALLVDPLAPVASGGWINTTLQTDVTGTSGGQATFYADAYPGDPDSFDVNWPDTVAGASVSIPEADQVYLASSHTWITGATVLPDVIESTLFVLGNGAYDFDAAGGPDFESFRSLVIFPAYRLWLPTVVTVEPLRLIQRGDGLGMGSGRLFGAGTRQGSGRVFGSL